MSILHPSITTKSNGLIPSEPLINVSTTTTTANKCRVLPNCNNEFSSSSKMKDILLIICLTFLFGFLLTITIEFSRLTILDEKKDLFSSVSIKLNLTIIKNETKFVRSSSLNSFVACVWFFNLLLFLICLFVHIFIYEKHLQHNRTRSAFLREFGRIFDDVKCSSRNSLIDYLLKTCLLCLLWYFCCYLIIRSMTILISFEIIILYSITITLRQVLGWIFLHEQFIGNKIIAHIVALSGLLFLAHNDGFHFNRFLLGLTMVTCSVIMKTTFDILINGFIKDLTSSKLRIIMINICLFGTCLLWPFPLLFHATNIEPIESIHFYSFVFLIALICALAFNVLTISMPIKYTSVSNVASLLLVIPSISLIDRYYFNVKYSPLVISAILCSFVGVLLSMIPKQWFQPGEATKMKQALGFINKDSINRTTTGTSTTFDEIKAQRRIRNALLYNDIKK